ncbi:MAG: type II toxin-antitoxin system Phd/YefM family antitoxin [Neisseriaceae bacterium]|jgi:prevent-host-death family protein
MKKFNIYDAKTNFSKIINLVEHHEEVLISKNGIAVAKIVPVIFDSSEKRVFGTLRGKIKVAKDFDDSLPQDIVDSFYVNKL